MDIPIAGVLKADDAPCARASAGGLASERVELEEQLADVEAEVGAARQDCEDVRRMLRLMEQDGSVGLCGRCLAEIRIVLDG